MTRTVIALVDRVLADLSLPDGMFVGRRAEAGDARSVVIQTGEDGRHRVPVDAGAIETFMAAAQAHVSDVHGRPVPRCPLHDHALVGRSRGDGADWVCPDGEWTCAVGDYRERTWPPDVGAGGLAAVLCGRLQRRGIAGWRRLSFTRRGGEWVARVGLWPMDSATMDAIARAAAPLAVEFEPAPEPLGWRIPL